MQKQQFGFVKKYFLGATLIISLVVAAVFFSQHTRIEKLTNSIMLQQARAMLGQQILTRKWITMHGGVYVKVKPGDQPNPFLSKQKGVKVNIKDESGNLYTLINPAIAVREISQISEREGAFELHVVSLDPVSPVTHQPDKFERAALLSFEQGEKERFTVEESENGPIYRYVAPVKFEQRCNKCHAFQNLKQGDIRGGISINIPMQKVREQLHETRLYSALSAVLVITTLLALLALLAANFMRKLINAQNELELAANTDNLTSLLNRNAAYQRLNEELSKNKRLGKPLTCLMLDIDHFKRINDQYGHLVGDKVLKFFADNLRVQTRDYDILCRYGGEEFLVLLPETGLTDAVKIAERYRLQMEQTPFVLGKQRLRITVSLGVTEANPGVEESRDSFIGRADRALYQAKQEGRNKVVINP